jgi:hypothetical protein
MKALTTPTANFGPFHTIEILEDRYRCDNTDLPFIVVGQGQIVDADTIVWPDPPTPAPVVPQEVTMRQARLALLQAGLLTAVNAAIAAMPSPQKDADQIEWEYSNSLLRSNPLVLALGPALGMSAEQMDALFIAASAL